MTGPSEERPGSPPPRKAKSTAGRQQGHKISVVGNPFSKCRALSADATPVPSYLNLYTAAEALKRMVRMPSEEVVGLVKSADPVPFEETLTIEHIEHLEALFVKGVKATGDNKVNKKTFLKLVVQACEEQAVDAHGVHEFFRYSDVYDVGAVSWFEVINCLNKRYSSNLVKWSTSHSIVTIELPPAIVKLTVHLRSETHVVSVNHIAEDLLVLVGENGIITHWSLKEMKMKQVFMTPPRSRKHKTTQILNATYHQLLQKLFISSGNCELLVYETKLFNFICKIVGLTSMPFKLDCGMTRYNECLVLYGDETGCVTAIIIPNFLRVIPQLRGVIDMNAQTLKLSTLMAKHGVKMYRWQIHTHSVNEIRYIRSMNAFVSCSGDPHSALVVGSIEGKLRIGDFHIDLEVQSKGHMMPPTDKDASPRRVSEDEYVYAIPRGATSFDFSEQSKMFATGGLDRVVRIWSPHVRSRPVEEMSGHRKPILMVRFHEPPTQNLLISLSQDKEIRLWDSQTYQELYILPPFNYLTDTRTPIQKLFLSSAAEKMFVLTDYMHVLNLKAPRGKEIKVAVGHTNKVMAIAIRFSTMSVISGCQDGVIFCWDIPSGKFLHTFTYPEDSTPGQCVTCLEVDISDRLLVSGHEDGLLRLWSLASLQCIGGLMRRDRLPVSALVNKQYGPLRWLVAAGWDRKVHFFRDVDLEESEVQEPVFVFKDVSFKSVDNPWHHNVHIQSMATGLGPRLATASDDGEIHIWNVTTESVYQCLIAPQPLDYERDNQFQLADLHIPQVAFLDERMLRKEYFGAMLISLGPYDSVHFWSLHPGPHLMAQFYLSKKKNSGISMAVTDDERFLIIGDNKGSIFVWNIANYALDSDEPEPPNLLTTWEAHTQSITAIKLVSSGDLLVTASSDFSIRLWTMYGAHVGIFGSARPWDINCVETYMHPLVPEDVLVSPLTTFSPLLDSTETTKEFLKSEQKVFEEVLASKNIQKTSLGEVDPKSLPPWPIKKSVPGEQSEQRMRRILTDNFLKEQFSCGPFQSLRCFKFEEPKRETPLEMKHEVRKLLRKSTMNTVMSNEGGKGYC